MSFLQQQKKKKKWNQQVTHKMINSNTKICSIFFIKIFYFDIKITPIIFLRIIYYGEHGSHYSVVGLDWLYLRLLCFGEEKRTLRAFGDCYGCLVFVYCTDCVCHYRWEKISISIENTPQRLRCFFVLSGCLKDNKSQ